MKDLYFNTTSSSKLRQFKAYFEPKGYRVHQLSITIPEFQSIDAASVALEKLKLLKELSDLRPLIVDDAGIEIEALGGFPGALLKPILELGGLALLRDVSFSKLDNERVKAKLISVIAIDTGDRTYLAKGQLEGILDFRDEGMRNEKECSGIFYPLGVNQSLLELKKEKGEATFAHRCQAMDKIYSFLGANDAH